MMRRRRRRRHAAGFTLVEVIVALAIAALVSLIVTQGIGLATQGVARLSDKIERLDQRRGLELRLRRVLGSVAAIPVFEGRPGFVGHQTSVSFLSIVDDGGPGLYRFTLAFEPARTGRPVTLTRQLANGAAALRSEEGVVARRVRSLSLGYFGAPTPADKPAWHRSWEGLTEAPRLLRIVFDDGDGVEHPPMILRLGTGG
jgi:prepilin-type N-terminal cleavage/methylation domain-containing protein